MGDLGKSICNKCGSGESYKGEAGLLFCKGCDEWLAPECFPDRPLGAGSSVQVTDAQVDAGAAAQFTWFSSEATTEEQRDIAREQVRRILTAALAAPPVSNLTGPNFGSHGSATAMFDVIAERLRQQEKEGWTPEHDDQHDDFSLAKAASVYAACASVGSADRAVMDHHGLRGTPGKLQELWPLSWDISWLKPTDRRRDLVKAAALIIAEIERLDRAALATTEGSDAG